MILFTLRSILFMPFSQLVASACAANHGLDIAHI